MKIFYYTHARTIKLYAQLGTCFIVQCPGIPARRSNRGNNQKSFVHYSERASKNPNPEFSRINGGGSTSATSTCCMDFEMSSTENGILRTYQKVKEKYYSNVKDNIKLFPEVILYLESSSNRKEVLTALLESSATIALMVVVTCIIHKIISNFVLIFITSQVFPVVQKLSDSTRKILQRD